MRVTIGVLIAGIAIAGLAESAHAQSGDLPVLRGSDYRPVPPTYRNWSGFYFGGQLGFASGTADLASIDTRYLNPLLGQTVITGAFTPVSGDWSALRDGHSNSTPVGGFAGYNWQSENAVWGIELNYNRFSGMTMGQSDSMTRSVTDANDYTYNVFSTRQVDVKLTDAVSMRMRAGAVIGQFMPYLTAGLAVGRMSVTSTATAGHEGGVHVSDPPIAPTSITATVRKSGAIAFGASGGLGVDMELVSNLLLRAEYEYLGFAAVEGVKTGVHTGRVGVGLRF